MLREPLTCRPRTRKGNTHRDIKSPNVLISAEGQAKILDFGLARVSGQPGVTREAAAGTPGAAADRRSDLWALGAVLHEMLTGKLPIGQTATLPERLGPIVRKALADDPRERYQHAEDMIVDLRRAVAPLAALEPHRRLSRLAWLGVPAVLGTLGLGVWHFQRPSQGVALRTVKFTIQPRADCQ